jgi:hypothetical protein
MHRTTMRRRPNAVDLCDEISPSCPWQRVSLQDIAVFPERVDLACMPTINSCQDTVMPAASPAYVAQPSQRALYCVLLPITTSSRVTERSFDNKNSKLSHRFSITHTISLSSLGIIVGASIRLP